MEAENEVGGDGEYESLGKVGDRRIEGSSHVN